MVVVRKCYSISSTGRGQHFVTLPVGLLRELGWSKGDKVKFSLHVNGSNGIVIKRF